MLPASLALIMTGFGIIIPVFPQRLEALGLGAGTLALMEGAFGLGTFLFSTPMGIWSNRFGRKPLVLFALFGFVCSNVLLALINTPALFIAVRFLEGTFVAGFFPTSMAMVGDVIATEKQGRWIGGLTTAQAGGLALGPAIGGVLYQSWGFTSPFLLSAGFALVASLLALVILPETLPAEVKAQELQRNRNKKQGGEEHPEQQSALISLVWLFAPLLLIDFGAIFIYPFSLPQYPFFFEKILHYSAAQYGLIISAYGVALGLFPFLLGRLSEAVSKKVLVVLGCLFSVSLNLGLLLLHQYSLLIVASIIAGVGSALSMPALGAMYLSAATDQNRSQLMGIRGTATSLALLIAPLAQAAAGPWITPQITFALAAGLSLAITVFAMFALKSPRQHMLVGNNTRQES